MIANFTLDLFNCTGLREKKNEKIITFQMDTSKSQRNDITARNALL